MIAFGYTFLSIATGKYTDYLIASIQSYRSLRIRTHIQWVIFTDDVTGMMAILKNGEYMHFTFVEVASLGWPDATLRRYELISSAKTHILGDTLVYLDADMRFVDRPTFMEPGWKATSSLVLTLHPGYYFANKIALLQVAYRSPKSFLKFMKVRLAEGGFGTWERRRTSLAFVPKFDRRKYVCGGIWFGERHRILDLCEELSQRTRIDTSLNVVARFHDESHLNWYLACNSDIQLLPPENCFAEGYVNLTNLRARIIAVEKNSLKP